MADVLIVVAVVGLVAVVARVLYKGVGRLVGRVDRAAERRQPTFRPAPPAETVEVNRAGISLAIAGATLMVVSSFLPRVESTTFATVTDNTLIASNEGFFIIGVAVGVVVATYTTYERSRQSWDVFIGGLLGIAAAVYAGTGDRLDLESVSALGSPLRASLTESASPGVGIYAAGAGAMLIVYGGLLLAGHGAWFGGGQARRTKTCPRLRRVCPS